MKNGKILFFDEIDIHLHPDLTKKLIRSLHLVKTEKKFQFVFTTHDIGLLDIGILRRDQIWIAEKDEYGASSLTSLIDLKSRKDISMAKQYQEHTSDIIENIEDHLIPKITLKQP